MAEERCNYCQRDPLDNGVGVITADLRSDRDEPLIFSDLTMWVNKDGGDFILGIGDYIGTFYRNAKVDINLCPFCGRRLRE